MKRLLSALMIGLLLVQLSACGGLHDSNSIHAKNLITNESIVIPLKVHNTANTGNFSNFTTELNQDRLMDALRDESNIKSIENIYQHTDVGYMRLSTDNGVFYIKYNGSKKENGKFEFNYTLFADVASISGGDYIYFPYYMLEKFPNYDYPSSALLSDGELFYNRAFILDDIEDYYKSKGIYTIEEVEKNNLMLRLLITDKSTGYRFFLQAFSDDGSLFVHAE